MRRIYILAIALIIALCSAVQAGEISGEPEEPLVLNLEEAVNLGLERNPEIKAMDFAIERSRSQIKSVRGRFLPRLSAGYSLSNLESLYAKGPTDQDYLDQTQDSWRVNLTQTLFAGGTIFNAYEKARLEEQARHIEKKNKIRELVRDVQENFLLLLKAREDYLSLQQTIKRLEVGYEATRSFLAKQMIAYVEVLAAKVELEAARQKLSQVENQEIVLKTRLSALLDLNGRPDVSFIGNLSNIELHHGFTIDRCIRSAMEERTDLQFIDNNIRMAEKEKAIALGERLPRISFEASAVGTNRDYENEEKNILGQATDRDQENHYWTAGINVQWNFFAGGEGYYRGQSMDYEIKRLEKVREDAVSTIRTEVRSAFLRLEEARQRIDAIRSNLETARESFRMEEERLKRRVGTIQNLLNAQDRLTRAETDLNQALLDFQMALADLHYAMGTRNDSLN